eukprot:5019033-Karenia_brevis.AAC.1
MSMLVEYINLHPKAFLRAVKKALMSEQCMLYAIPDGRVSSTVVDDDVVFCCDMCNKSFKSKQACNMHESKVRGWIHPA